MDTKKMLEKKISLIKRNIEYYKKVYPGCKKINQLVVRLEEKEKELALLS